MAENYEDRAHKQLQIESWSNSARTLLIRGSTPGGPFAEQHTTNADRSLATSTFELHGLPTSMQISPLTVPVRRGECYVRATLMMDGEPVLRLSAGYLTDSKTMSWPPGVFEGFTEGPGYTHLFSGTNPAAGVEVSETVPTNTVWKVKSIFFTLVTDATVANRQVKLLYNDGASNFVALNVGAVQAASLTRYHQFFIGAPRETAFIVGVLLTPLPGEMILPQGYIISTSTGNMQAGDDYAAPLIEVEEWIEE